MGFDDLFHFDEAAYAAKVSYMSNNDLLIWEQQKIRQFLAGSCSAGLGVGTAPATGGLSLGFTAFAGRNMQIAKAKLNAIQAELLRRGVPLREKLSTGDRLVPVMGGLAAMAVGGAVEGNLASDHVAAA